MAFRTVGPATEARRRSRILTPVTCVHRVIGFISQTSRTFDAASIDAQKIGIDAAAGIAGVPVQAYLIELSPPRSGVLWTPAVGDLLRSARAGGLDAVFLEHVDRLAHERDAALLAAVTLLECGVKVIEARCGPVANAEAVVVQTRAVRSAKRRAIDASVRS